MTTDPSSYLPKLVNLFLLLWYVGLSSIDGRNQLPRRAGASLDDNPVFGDKAERR